jgi:hypothetical protein
MGVKGLPFVMGRWNPAMNPMAIERDAKVQEISAKVQ